MFTKNLYDINFRGSATQEPHLRVLAVGPLNKQPCTMLYRVVLIERRDEFVVCREQFDAEPIGDICNQSHFSEGHYFLCNDDPQSRVDVFVNAMQRYLTTLERDMQCLPSIVRD